MKPLLHKLFIDKTDHGIIQLIRYGFVVMVAFPIDFGLLYIFKDKLHMYVVLAAVLSFSISMVANYFLSVLWVFDRNTGRALWFDSVVFAVIGFVGLGLTAGLMWTLTEHWHIQYLIAKLLAVSVVFFWSFGARRYLFHKRPAESITSLT